MKYRSAKRQFLHEHIEKPKIESLHKDLQLAARGLAKGPMHQPKNAFLHPEDKDAVTPKIEIQQPIDLRLVVA